jgi:hypothetical protein
MRFVIYVCLSVRPSACMEKLGFCYMEFHNILYEDFSKIYRENTVIKPGEKKRYFT